MVPAELAGGSHDRWAPSELWREGDKNQLACERLTVKMVSKWGKS